MLFFDYGLDYYQVKTWIFARYRGSALVRFPGTRGICLKKYSVNADSSDLRDLGIPKCTKIQTRDLVPLTFKRLHQDK